MVSEIKFDYSKFNGLVKEKGLTQKMVAKIIHTTETTLNKKLNNKSYFTQKEIRLLSNALKIDDCNIGTYFFTVVV